MTAAAGEPAVVPAYFDPALVAKFYLNEPGRDQVRRLAGTSGVVMSSGIAVAEVPAAFHRKLRDGAVTLDVFKALQGQFVHGSRQRTLEARRPHTEALLREVPATFARLNTSVFVRSSTPFTW